MAYILGLVQRVERRWLIFIVVVTVVIVGAGAIITLFIDPEQPWLGLDSEHSIQPALDQIAIAIPTLWSGILFALSGVAWLAVASAWPRSSTRLAPLLLALFLLFAGFDDNFMVHERLEGRLGVEWLVLYAPLVLIVAVCMSIIIMECRHSDRRAAIALSLGGILWAAAQVLELLQWDGDEKVAGYVILMIPEEVGETVGLLLIGLAAVSVARSIAVSPDQTEGAT